MFIECKQLFHWRRAFHKGREFAACKRFIAGVMMFAAAAAIEAAPTGGSVRPGGSADISLGSDTVIDQHTHRVDIDWTGFDTTSDESVTFNQECGSSSLAVNRISGARTQFDGTLNANGRIFLINQNGITFGSTSQLNAGSLLATTSELDDDREDVSAQGWGDGHNAYTFSNSGYASVVNEGDITVSDGGFAVLAAPRVENRGFIKADLGQIELVSTRAFKINVDFRGDGLITFQTDQDSFENDEITVDGPLGVENADTATLQARSGHVYLTSARFAGDVVQGVINLNGVVDADQFVEDGNGQVAMIASGYGGYHSDNDGGEIVVKSATDINIGGGADIHAIGGEQVAASFEAKGDINMGAEGDPAKITLKADSGLDGRFDSNADAGARLEMIAKHGSLNIAEGEIEVTADAVTDQPVYDGGNVNIDTAGFDYSRDNNARAVATALLEGEQVDINADITVTAAARATAKNVYKIDPVDAGTATCFQCGGHGTDGAEALAALDVYAKGDYEVPGDLAMKGDINVNAVAVTEQSGSDYNSIPFTTSGFGPGPGSNDRTAKATANTVLVATGDLDVEGDINVNAGATSEPGAFLEPPLAATSFGCQTPYCNTTPGDAADANAALVMLGGAPGSLSWLLHRISFDLPFSPPGTLSDILTLANAGDLLGSFDSFDGSGGPIGNFGSGGVTYKGDINVTSRAEFNAAPRPQFDAALTTFPSRTEGTAQATSAAVIASGGDEYINTDPIRVESLALANHDEPVFDGPVPGYTASLVDDGYVDSQADTEARSFLVFAAGLGDHPVAPTADDLNGDNGYHGSDLTILGAVSATAYELETLNGEPHPYPDNPLTGALTALLATGDIKVRGADPLAEAGPLSDDGHTATAQGRSSMWQSCDSYGCDPVEDGIGGLEGLVYGGNDLHLAQLVIEAGGEIDIQPKTKNQPAGLFMDPVGPDWPGNLPLRFDAGGRMLVATGADATRPPRIMALASDVEAAILAGGDPSTLLPPTASGGCVAAGRDAYTVSTADYFDRLISTSCESKK